MSSAPRSQILDWDEGVASERTVLAWERTAISSLAVAALVVRAGIVYHLLALAIPIAVLLAIAAIAEWRFGTHVYAEHDRPFEYGAVVHDRMLTALALVTLAAAAASAALGVAG